MISGSDRLRTNIFDLERSISMLSLQINNAGVIWRDSKFQELKANITVLAASTSNVLLIGRDCCEAISEFQRISEEV